IGTMTSTSTLSVTSANTGEANSNSAVQTGSQLDAVHLVNFSANTVGGTITVGELNTGTIGTMTSTSTLSVTSANTGEAISIGTMQTGSQLDAVHLVNFSANTVGGTITVGELNTGTIGTMTSTSTLSVTSANTGE